MSSLTSKRFVVRLADSSESTPRASRRLIINANIAKAAKLCAGDVIALSDCDNAEDTKVSPDGGCIILL
jgi:AAA family ATPase